MQLISHPSMKHAGIILERQILFCSLIMCMNEHEHESDLMISSINILKYIPEMRCFKYFNKHLNKMYCTSLLKDVTVGYYSANEEIN